MISSPMKEENIEDVIEDGYQLDDISAADIGSVRESRISWVQIGRNFQRDNVSVRYSDTKKKQFSYYESVNYLPSHSLLFQRWIQHQNEKRLVAARWLIMGLIGFFVGIIGYLLRQSVALISQAKLDLLLWHFEKNEFTKAWLLSVSYTALFVLVSSSVVVYVNPAARGSGMAQVCGYLNGANIENALTPQTLIIKFVSCACAIGSGMPVGPEAPMIHIGAIVGSGLANLRCNFLKVKIPGIHRLGNSEDKRNFVSAGTAAGIAAAFSAPIGGLLFSMEEVSSFWTKSLTYQIFFCCTVATFVAGICNSATEGFRPKKAFGFIENVHFMFAHVDSYMALNGIIFIPTIILGIAGGFWGALFTFTTLKISKLRTFLVVHIQHHQIRKLFQCFEPVIIMILISTIYLTLPNLFGCTSYSHLISDGSEIDMQHLKPNVIHYKCDKGRAVKVRSETYWNGSYSEVATIFLLRSEKVVQNLFSRINDIHFDYPSLITAFILYFLFVCWAIDTSVACGMFVPVILIGGLFGRIFGRGWLNILHLAGYYDPVYLNWSDPGIFALIGAAAVFGGVTRLTTSVTVIMIELTNDLRFILPIMAAVMIAKFIGDFFTHNLIESHMEMKCIPYLDVGPRLQFSSGSLNAEQFTAADVMATPVVTMYPKQSVYKAAQIILTTTHSGFPIVKKKSILSEEEYFYGLITRAELCVLLMKRESFRTIEELDEMEESEKFGLQYVTYEEMMGENILKSSLTFETLYSYLEDGRYLHLFVNLYPFINESTVSVPKSFSLYRTYLIFRTLGLRHLVVVDELNCIKGIITRKDLLTFNILERIKNRRTLKTVDGKVLAKRNKDNQWDVKTTWDTSMIQ